ncbi:lactonase family protein [Spiractinospora alimapuensis]|uniref:lactonase family protein n=1 Tax=Spiractinospora alimapuensis TaxID=2820884 RepID=UPI001F247ECF|nr:lactonase family protein [Spiractinospora alimapuensis]QVQ54471.1 lactonase family protein [Spiractinospora alimapuensis]
MRQILVGTYTGERGGGRGIYRMWREADGALTQPELVAEQDSPSYLALHPGGRALYAVAESADSGVVHYDFVDGRPRLRGRRAIPAGPCHLVVTPSGEAVLSASYDAGTVNSQPLGVDGGFVGATTSVAGYGSGPDPERQEGPHAHAVAIAPDGTVLSTDLGADLVRAHRLDAETGTLRPVAAIPLPEGCGPRHVVVHASGHVYVLTELAGGIAVLAPRSGYADLELLAHEPATRDDVPGDALGAAIRVSDDGRFVYTSTRGADLVTTHQVKADGTRLRPVADVPTGGRWPRDFCVDGQWLHVANEHSATVCTFRLSPRTGAPEPFGDPVPVPSPVCLLPLP